MIRRPPRSTRTYTLFPYTTLFRSATFLLSLSFLTSCSLSPDKKDESNQNLEDFVVTSLSAVGEDGGSNLSGWAISPTRNYQFTACLESKSQPAPIIGQEFKIIEADYSNEAKTDRSGCLTWNRELEVNPFGNSSAHAFKGSITGRGVYSGATTYNYSLSPLAGARAEGVQEFVWTDKHAISKNISTQDYNEAIAAPFMAANNVLIKSDDIVLDIVKSNVTSEGMSYLTKLRMTPKYQYRNIQGNLKEEAISTGKYRVYAELLLKTNVDRQEKRIKLLELSDPNKVYETVNGEIRINYKGMIGETLGSGVLELKVLVEPVGVDYLEGTSGLFSVGDLSSLVGSHSVHKTEASAEEAVVTSISSLPKEMIAKKLNISGTSVRFAFTDNSINPKVKCTNKKNLIEGEEVGCAVKDGNELKKLTGIKALPNTLETATTKFIVYMTSFSALDVEGQPLRLQRFNIYQKDEKGNLQKHVQVASNMDGRVTFSDTMMFKVYKSAELKRVQYVVENRDTGVKTNLEVFVNPWSIFTTGHGGESVDSEFRSKMANRLERKSYPWALAFFYEVSSVRYEIDQHMNLSTNRMILLDVPFFYKRDLDIDEGSEHLKSLRDGIYVFKAAIHKHYLDNRKSLLKVDLSEDGNDLIIDGQPGQKKREFVSIVKKLVRVRNGRVITPVEFKLRDLRLMTVRTNMIVQIEPVDISHLDLSTNINIDELNPERIQEVYAKNVLNKKALEKSLVEGRSLNEMDPNPHVMSPEYLAELKKPKFDLDMLIDHDSGLELVAFTGPLIFEEYAGEAGIMRTDIIQDCVRIDCSSVSSLSTGNKVTGYSFENEDDRKYFGDIRYLKNKTIYDFESTYAKQELEYHSEEVLKRQLGYFLDYFGLDYFSTEGKKLKRFKGEKLADGKFICKGTKIENCLEDSDTKLKDEDFYGYMNFNYNLRENGLHNVVSKDEVKNFINNGGRYNELFGRRLCSLFIHKYLGVDAGVFTPEEYFNATKRRTYGRGKFPGIFASYNSAYNKCLREVKNGKPVFNVATHYRVNEVGGFVFRGGKKVNFDVGNDMSISFGESISNGLSLYAFLEGNPLAAAGKVIPKMGGFTDIFSAAIGVNASTSAAVDRSWADSINVSSSTYLSMQRADFDMWFSNYEKCVQVNLSKPMQEELLGRVNKYLPKRSEIEAYHGRKGLFLCTGDTVKTEVANEWVRERFYYFSQHFTFGQLLDDNDLLNQPWLLAMRGEVNYFNFVSLLKDPKRQIGVNQEVELERQSERVKFDEEGNPIKDKYDPWFVTKMANGFVSKILDDEQHLDRAGEVRNLGELPLDIMEETYKNMTPPFPGIFTLRPAKVGFPY